MAHESSIPHFEVVNLPSVTRTVRMPRSSPIKWVCDVRFVQDIRHNLNRTIHLYLGKGIARRQE